MVALRTGPGLETAGTSVLRLETTTFSALRLVSRAECSVGITMCRYFFALAAALTV